MFSQTNYMGSLRLLRIQVGERNLNFQQSVDQPTGLLNGVTHKRKRLFSPADTGAL
jgi:hypothetical protein